MLASSSISHSLWVVTITLRPRTDERGELTGELDLHGRVQVRLRLLDDQHVAGPTM